MLSKKEILKIILEKKIESNKRDVMNMAVQARETGSRHGRKGEYNPEAAPNGLGAFYDAGVQDAIDRVSIEQQEKFENPPVLEKYNKRKQDCKQSDGDRGGYVLSYTTKKGEKRRACHTSKKNMQGQIAAIEAEADISEKEILDATSAFAESDQGPKKYTKESAMKITKRQLRRIIKEEKARILKEQEVASNSGQHHYPSADNAIANVVGELAEGWHDMELAAWSAGDPSMNQQGELSDAESKEYWGEQVEAATDALDKALRERLRSAALEVMEDYTSQLINGDFA